MNRGRNFLLEQAYKDLGRAAFHQDLIVVAVCVAVSILVGVLT